MRDFDDTNEAAPTTVDDILIDGAIEGMVFAFIEHYRDRISAILAVCEKYGIGYALSDAVVEDLEGLPSRDSFYPPLPWQPY